VGVSTWLISPEIDAPRDSVNDSTDDRNEPSPVQRQTEDLLQQVRDRVPGDWEPQLKPGEQLQLKRIAERLTMVGRTPGWLMLTDERLVFDPAQQPIWFPLSVRMPRDGLRVRRSRRLSRLLRLRGIDPAVAPTYLHVADIKISRGRQAVWFRVHDAEEWEHAIAAAAGSYSNNERDENRR
jgi:hypothetical protein